jgi:hypothetical protein
MILYIDQIAFLLLILKERSRKYTTNDSRKIQSRRSNLPLIDTNTPDKTKTKTRGNRREYTFIFMHR